MPTETSEYRQDLLKKNRLVNALWAPARTETLSGRHVPWEHLIILLAFAGVLFFFRMGAHDLWSPDEPRYAQVAREMLKSGDWIVPHLNGEIYTEKPPLYFWLVAALSRSAGDVNETTARMPSAAAAALVMLVTFFFGSHILGRREALIGTLVMATSAQFVWIGRIGVIDMLLALCILGALCLFYVGYSDRNFLFYLAGFLFLGPAALAKGPVGVALPIVVMLAFLLLEVAMRQEGAKRELVRFGLCVLLGSALVALMVGPWWRAAYERSGGVYGSVSILLKQTRGRMVESYSHRRPLPYYFYNILWQLIPWTLLLPPAACTLGKRANLREHRPLRFLLVWVAAIFIFFTLMSGKRSQYILPLFPAAGLLIGWALVHSNPLEGRLKDRKEYLLPLAALALMTAAGILAFPAIFRMFLPRLFWSALPLALAALVVLYVFARRASARPPAFALTYVIVATTLLAAVVFAYIAPAVDKYKSARPFCTSVQAAVAEEDPLFFFRVYRPNINYYMGRSMKRLDSSEEVLQALEGRPHVYLVLERRKLELLDLGPSAVIEQITRSQIGSRDMVCVAARRVASQ